MIEPQPAFGEATAAFRRVVANVRTVIADDFESGVGRWKDDSDSTSTGLTQSAESILVGGHSIKLGLTGSSSASRFMTTEVGGIVAPNRSYSLTYWARGTGTVQRDGK